MLLIDSLIVVGIAAFSLGTIHEEDGVKEHTFQVVNVGQMPVTLNQGYTSCGCTTIHFSANTALQPGDTTAVTLRFNPRGKGGEFHEHGTLTYGPSNKRLGLALVGECITSEETLLKQFPIRVSETLRLSADRYDIGMVRVGQTKERSVAVLHWDENNPSGPRETEIITVTCAPTQESPRGLQHLSCPIKIKHKGKIIERNIILDAIIR